ncbi:MAG: hypothetical protein DNFNHJIP_00627 [Candidatus Argoarchaeum ethanivorans]|uniref:Uncharacterized protein n=1 Tax=Candidatus Argoarchaeum ethanivorans TaxID=2608793 RepID=A0A812A2I0_9EURY|nr:MAG: hypothetical protein DNFNHJIP_00627 [Candidatus Argoarchaeum ethanivorans]
MRGSNQIDLMLLKIVIFLTLLLLMNTAAACITQDTTVIINSKNITSTTTVYYTGNDSTRLQTMIDMQGDNNSYVNAWELLKYENTKRKQMVLIPYTVENASIQQINKDVTIDRETIGKTNTTRQINVSTTLSSDYTCKNKTLITIKPPDNRTSVLIHENMEIEQIIPLLKTKEVECYQQVTLQINDTTTFKLAPKKKAPIVQNTTEYINTSEVETTANQQNETDNMLFIVFAIPVLLIILLITLYRRK